MAAVDPDAAPEFEDDVDSSKPPRATLKIVRPPPGLDFDDEEDDDDYEEDEGDESDEDSDDEEVNGGPSDKEKAKKLREAAALKDLEEAMEEDDSEGDDDEIDIKAAISKLIKGKAPAIDDDEDDEDEDDDDEGLELEEIVVCTLDPQKVGVTPAIYKPLLCFVANQESQIALPTTTRHHCLSGRADLL
jgi:FK506-binding nuclear protein